ncbi:NAD(P)H-hydrate epimerase [Filimonas lacunae]|uniref:Bifunctional NAD(P)H-hydrate repair enzyme n=1 Tax=Filimonas lacunae TaxID=477680 RepID=A0A173MF68_9BACT|nr:bifunctional ADP-dependent NAD(P)H-hydrate dehydratase/NAD(P)H-hydrate epimerase [Filimonas lacunae]BAV06244.1 NAD(P)HX epimerase [Filimonas lacunae]SIT25436.1 NAD(P)H-hydrate epimerase [Filimonas lacunae]
MKLLSAQQIQQWDAYTIASLSISSTDLMETAAKACCNWLIQQAPEQQTIRIFCGKGNNGGDGLAIARLLLEKGIHSEVYILEQGSAGTPDFQTNLQRLHKLSTAIHYIQDSSFFPVIHSTDILIDALYGSGLNRPLQGLPQQLVTHMNNSPATICAIDVPSGMYIQGSSKGNTIIQASHTLTFQSLKLCFMLAENAAFCGNVQVLHIGLNSQFPETVTTSWEVTTTAAIAQLYQPRNAFSHKGSFGHALLVAGSHGKTGAAVLAARACLRSGIGLLTVHVPDSGYTIIQSSVPEAMCITTLQQSDAGKYACIGAGPGMGTEQTAVQLLDSLLQWNADKPLVLDADALNIISTHPEWLSRLPAGSVLTPHPKEFDRLFGPHNNNEYERLEKALAITMQWPLVIVLKGHHTLVASEGKGYFNTTGNAGMATGGSGDVLTGIITSLLSQYKNGLTAARLGVYLHGLAADLSLDLQSEESLLPSDIIRNMGKAFHWVHRSKKEA